MSSTSFRKAICAAGVPAAAVINFGTNCHGKQAEGRQNFQGTALCLIKNLVSLTTTRCDSDEMRHRRHVTMELKAMNKADSFPNFSRHGKDSLLKKYLTQNVYDKLVRKETSLGVRLDDMIRAGVSLPLGATPPRGVAGIYAGDAESYRTFSLLLDPIIGEYHRSEKTRRGVQRHKTNLDPMQLHTRQLDPDGRYILYTRLRLARSLEGFRFSPCITRQERRVIERIVVDCCNEWNKGKYLSVMDMSNAMHDDLIKRRILPQDPDLFAASAGTHRDWPDARGAYCDTWETGTLPSIMVWCNMEDHVWIISTSKGGNVQDVFSKLSKAVLSFEESLHRCGHKFVNDRRLGFLNSSPANIGTALRASVHVKLVRLGRHPGFDNFVRRLRLEARAEYLRADQRYSGIFDIGNKQALGKSDVELINVMIDGVARLIELEKRLERGEEIDLTREAP
ncbi:hypothetical protein ACA910_008546 [Epithemia clementina (nom. ined.)]